MLQHLDSDLIEESQVPQKAGSGKKPTNQQSYIQRFAILEALGKAAVGNNINSLIRSYLVVIFNITHVPGNQSDLEDNSRTDR